jgi:hypothetical protein
VVSDVATACAPGLPKRRDTLAIFGRVVSSLLRFLDGVNRWGSELVYDLHWLGGVILPPTGLRKVSGDSRTELEGR